MREVAIVSAKRSAIGSFMGSLKGVKPAEIATQVAKGVLEGVGLGQNKVEEVILGEILQAGQGQNVARQVCINTGCDEGIGAYTINKLCGSGLKAMHLAYQSIALGEKDIILAGGVENMSGSPYVLENIRDGYKMGTQNISDTMIKDALTDAFHNYHMGVTAENLAKKYNIGRQEQDEFALQSQQKASKAQKEGKFKDEIVPIVIKGRKGDVVFENDEFIKHDASLDAFAKLRPAFDKEGTVTAANASGINDGAAIALIMSKEMAEKLNMPILATIKGFASVGVDPSIMGIGAAMALKKVLENTKLTLNDIDLVEANEAFASQSLACIKELDAKKYLDKFNVNGGAIALGHPVGASGARIVATLLSEMKKRGSKYGAATLCVGGGQGIAAIFERK